MNKPEPPMDIEVYKMTLLAERVLKLEKWQSFIMGGVAVLYVFVLPICLYLIFKMFNS